MMYFQELRHYLSNGISRTHSALAVHVGEAVESGRILARVEESVVPCESSLPILCVISRA